jgi:HEAT repeat protein
MKGEYRLEVRERVIDVIGKIGDMKSVEALMGILDDPHPSIRLAAIDSLIFCFDSVPLKKLTYVMRSDSDDEVRKKAQIALQILTMEKFFP